MRKFQWSWLLIGPVVLALALALAACHGDNDDNGDQNDDGGANTNESGGFNPDTGSGLEVSLGSGSGMPGCNDPNDDECPAPLIMDLDGAVSADGVSLTYPTRYFTAVSGDDAPPDVLIEIGPSEGQYSFDEQATFRVYFAASVEAALSELTEPETAEWSTDTLSEGIIGVVKDREQDPPVNTVIGAFPLDDGRAIVLKLVTTGTYGWDLYSVTYEAMLNSLTVGRPADSSSEE